MPVSQETPQATEGRAPGSCCHLRSGALDSTALAIGLRTTSEKEQRFRHTIGIAMNAIRHELPVELSETQIRECGEKGLLAVSLPRELSPLTAQAYAERVAAEAVRAALALRAGGDRPHPDVPSVG